MPLNRIETLGLLAAMGIIGPIQYGLDRRIRRRRAKALEQGAEEAYFEERRALKAYPPSSRRSLATLVLCEALLLVLIIWTALDVV